MLQELVESLKIYREYVEGKKFLVTGGAGFIGSWVCDAIISLGGSVICVDNLSTGNHSNIKHLLDSPNFTFINGNVEDLNPDDFKGVDYVLHLASMADPHEYQKYPISTMLSNSMGTLKTLQIAELNSATYLLASTSEVYGDPLEHPQNEEHWGNVNPIGPRACYDESKRFAEALTMSFHREKNLDIRIARIFNTYGPRLMDGRVVPKFIKQLLNNEPLTIYGNGTQTRSFCYITDLVEGLFHLLFRGKPGVYNLGNPDERSILEVVDELKRITGMNPEITFHPLPQDDPTKRRPDITKAREELGFEPKVDFSEGLRRTFEWFRNEVMK
ncbi:MAG: SDR family NAD-dependent epimerase/dehydratase [Candidatus Aenigmatarchaeota archaeon]|nr:MAG: SDR family NAD-dependent epimerase/dehydratase [Candidatus Aenigmarchaeota archaeon]